jgi:hypothetical protein
MFSVIKKTPRINRNKLKVYQKQLWCGHKPLKETLTIEKWRLKAVLRSKLDILWPFAAQKTAKNWPNFWGTHSTNNISEHCSEKSHLNQSIFNSLQFNRICYQSSLVLEIKTKENNLSACRSANQRRGEGFEISP